MELCFPSLNWESEDFFIVVVASEKLQFLQKCSMGLFFSGAGYLELLCKCLYEMTRSIWGLQEWSTSGEACVLFFPAASCIKQSHQEISISPMKKDSFIWNLSSLRKFQPWKVMFFYHYGSWRDEFNTWKAILSYVCWATGGYISYFCYKWTIMTMII